VNRLTEEALRALSRAKTPEAVGAALELLPDGEPRARQTLLDRYRSLAGPPSILPPRRGGRSGGGIPDSGCQVRAALLRGLRGRALPSDIPLLEEALRTYELRPRDEVAGGLRAAALLVLADLDEPLAAFHAVRLLGDPHTHPMSGEPAVTAARLLRSQGHTLVLYQALLRAGVQPEVAAVCFESLAGAPASVLVSLAQERWRECEGAALLALVDLLLAHPEAGRLATTVAAIVEESEDLDVVRYAAAAIVAGRRAPLIEVLRARSSLPGERGDLVRQALTLLPG
jgi:hypothetical protein